MSYSNQIRNIKRIGLFTLPSSIYLNYTDVRTVDSNICDILRIGFYTAIFPLTIVVATSKFIDENIYNNTPMFYNKDALISIHRPEPKLVQLKNNLFNLKKNENINEKSK